MDIVNSFFIFGATYAIYLMFLLTLVLGIKGKTLDKKAFLLAILGISIALLLIKIIHLFYFEPRPFVANNFIPMVKEAADASFPSRHATISAVIAFAFIFLKSKWSFLFFLLALWIGISRIFVGVHYWWDILGGLIVAATSVAIPLIFFQIYRHFR